MLEGILPEPYYTHYFWLVAGISNLLRNKLSIGDTCVAQDLLDNFYKPIMDLYGMGVCSYLWYLLSLLRIHNYIHTLSYTHILRHIPGTMIVLFQLSI